MKIVSNALSTGAAGGSGVSHSDTPNLSELWQRASSNKTGARKRLQKGNLRFSAMGMMKRFLSIADIHNDLQTIVSIIISQKILNLMVGGIACWLSHKLQ